MAKFNVVTTFEHRNNTAFCVSVCNFLKWFCQPLIVKLVDLSVIRVVNLVILVGVKPSRYQNNVWLKLHKSWEHLRCEFLSPCFSSRSSWWNWYVQNSTWVYQVVILGRVLFCWASTRVEAAWVHFVIVPEVHWSKQYIFPIIKIKPWLELPSLHLAGREWGHISFLNKFFWFYQCFDNFLRTVTMVNIEINDRDFLDFLSVLGLEVSCSNCHVIYEAEAIWAGFLTIIIMESFTKNTSMVTRWPSSTKSIPVLLTHHCVTSLDHCTSSQ